MNRKLLGLILAIAAVALPFVDKFVPKPTPSPFPSPSPVETPPSIADPLKAGFAGAKQEAGYWAGLLYGMARTIDADKNHPAGARLKTMLDVAALRDWIVACPPVKIGKGEVIGQAIGPELAKLGVSDEPIDQDDRRSKVVTILNQAANTLEGIAK